MPSQKYSSFFSGTIIFEAFLKLCFLRFGCPPKNIVPFFPELYFLKLFIFTFEGPPKNIVPFVWKLCLFKVVDVALLALDFSSWEVSVQKLLAPKDSKRGKKKNTNLGTKKI